MKNFIPIIVVLSLLILSCEENFNPIGEVRDQYVLTLVLRGDTTHQAATLYKNYSVDGFDPYSNTTEPSVHGADIRVWQGDSVYVFNEKEIDRGDDSRYSGTKVIYENNKFIMNENSSNIEVEVLFPLGKRMKAFSTTPQEIVIEQENSASAITGLNEFFRVVWSSGEGEIYYQPRLIITYQKASDPEDITYEKEVPISYNDDEPIFARPSKDLIYIQSNEVLSRAMEEIGNEGGGADNIFIDKGILKILVFDKVLTSYYISTNSELDGFSIKVDGTDFSNIEGGFGIFGSYRLVEYNMKVLREYIESFGYTALNPD